MIESAVSVSIVIFLLFFIFWGVKVCGKGQLYEDYFSKAQTQSLKGIGGVLILLSHIGTYLNGTFHSLYLVKDAGMFMVACFFFISGYGLQYGVMHKKDYLHGFFRKRMLSIAVPYYIINVFYIIANKWNMHQILVSLTGYNLWFVTAIAVFYIGFYICGKLFDARHMPAAVGVFTIICIIAAIKFKLGFWWYKSSPAFAVGVLVCTYKDKFRDLFKRGYFIKASIMILVFILCYICYLIHENEDTFIFYAVTIFITTLYAVLCAVLSMKIHIDNPLLRFFGNISLELYLTHALWIFWLRTGTACSIVPALRDSDTLYFAGILLGTVVMSQLVHIISKFILKIFSPKRVNKNIETNTDAG